MKEVEHIKELLMSENSKELAISLAKSQNLMKDVIKSIYDDIKKMIQETDCFKKYPSDTIILKFEINSFLNTVLDPYISLITNLGYIEINGDPDIQDKIELFFHLSFNYK